MSRPCSSADMPPDALHTAMTMPMISAVVALADERVLACVTAWLNTFEAPGGSVLSMPLTSLFTMLEFMCSSLVRPSRAMGEGISARNLLRLAAWRASHSSYLPQIITSAAAATTR